MNGSLASAWRGQGAVAIICLSIMLAGCTSDPQQMELLCSDFESSWNTFAAEAREDIEISALNEKLNDTSKTWNDLADLGGPSNVTDVVRNASSNLLSLWNASSNADRHSQATSLRNAGDYVSLQCEKSNYSIELNPLGLSSKSR